MIHDRLVATTFEIRTYYDFI